MSDRPNPFVPATVESVVARLQATMDRWRQVHDEADSHAGAEAEKRKARHPARGPAGE